MDSSKRDILNHAQGAFWASIAKAYPHINAGDFPLHAQLAFDEACKKAVDMWLWCNRPQDPLDVLRAMGFEEIQTGGGCTALTYERPDGEGCYVTNECDAPKRGEGWHVGIYDGEHVWTNGVAKEGVTFYKPDELITALARIAAWRVG